MFNHSFVNITPFGCPYHIEEVEKTQKDTPNLLRRFVHIRLHVLEDRLLELPLDLKIGLAITAKSSQAESRNYLLARVISAGLAMETEESTQVELGRLEKLDLSHMDLRLLAYTTTIPMVPVTYILERVDALGGLLDLASDNLRNELLGQLSECARAGLTGHDLDHLLPDCADLRSCGIGGLLDLVRPPLGEGNGEETEEVVVGGLDNDVGLNEGLPLADERAELVGCEVEAVEVGQAVLALDFVDPQLDFAERMVLVLLEIGERNLEYAALESIVCVLETGGAVHESLTDTVERQVFSMQCLERNRSNGESWRQLTL